MLDPTRILKYKALDPSIPTKSKASLLRAAEFLLCPAVRGVGVPLEDGESAAYHEAGLVMVPVEREPHSHEYEGNGVYVRRDVLEDLDYSLDPV